MAWVHEFGPQIGVQRGVLEQRRVTLGSPRVHITPSCLDRNQSLVLACSMRGRYGP